MPTDVAARVRARFYFSRLEDGAGADGVIGGLVDQDERAAVAVLGIRIGDDDGAGSQSDRANVVQPQLNWLIQLVERLRVQAGMQLLHRGPNALAGLLERQPVAGPQR